MKEKNMNRVSNPVIPDYRQRTEKTKEKEIGLSFKPCLVCTKQIFEGYYARWGDAGVCSKTCNDTQSLKPLYPLHGSLS